MSRKQTHCEVQHPIPDTVRAAPSAARRAIIAHANRQLAALDRKRGYDHVEFDQDDDETT